MNPKLLINHYGRPGDKEKSVDIKRDRGYVVAPFSIHPTGGLYQVVDPGTMEPFSADKVNWGTFEMDRISTMPISLYEALRKKGKVDGELGGSPSGPIRWS